jgi:hypothetical protein
MMNTGLLAWKKQLDAPECAVLGAFSKAGQRRGLLPARRNNAAGQIGRGAMGCIALSSRVIASYAQKLKVHAACERAECGQLLFLGLIN